VQGLQLYQEIFNGQFCPSLVASGGHLGNAVDEAVLHHPATGLQPWLRGIPTKHPIMAASATRHLFETTARRLVSDNPRVTFMYAAAVTGLLFEEQGRDAAAAAAADNQCPEDLCKTVTGGRPGVGSLLGAGSLDSCHALNGTSISHPCGTAAASAATAVAAPSQAGVR